MENKLKEEYKFLRRFPLNKYVFESKEMFINFLDNILNKLEEDIELEKYTLHDTYSYIRIDSFKEFKTRFLELNSYYNLSINVKSNNINLCFEVYDFENIHFKTKLLIAGNNLDEVKKLETILKLEFERHINKWRVILNPVIQFAIAMTLALIMFKLNGTMDRKHTSMFAEYHNFSFWIIIFFSVAVTLSIELIFFPKFKIKLKGSLNSRFTKFLHENKNAIIVSLFFTVVSLVLSKIV